MKIYTVGGAVRDELLGLPVKDRDHVVVGACPEDLVKLGFKPVGKDFPVFLHPETHEEYALARTERKVARGYHGFEFYAAPDVTLEQDLERRDLTINAIARDETGRLIDPFGGGGDIKARVLRHVSPAFAEDPVRILRVARFAARFGFTIAPETFELMRRMVANGEVDALVAERVWQEFSRGLMEENPSRMLEILRECGALARIAPEVDGLLASVEAGAAMRAAVDAAARAGASIEARFAALVRSLDPLAVEAFCARLKVPAASRELALLATRHANVIADAAKLDAQGLIQLLDAADAWRRPERFLELVAAALAGEPDAGEFKALLERALNAGAAVDAGAIAKAAPGKAGIRTRIGAARLAAIERVLKKSQ
ncbi:MAG: multifunctional CCA tRNA nucleotidyl transferase/2'3'-cyclic phosphodiesterase/2'nucleotidase/phosphatase [Betaproteobacteria bacterium]|nr:multifunctional CCA tRNA nucleotidyl transferase/2'3'-cyclic phosphodiesterase/2'nucleotidase/phosphatase [Betaproteobacteria bacterium]